MNKQTFGNKQPPVYRLISHTSTVTVFYDPYLHTYDIHENNQSNHIHAVIKETEISKYVDFLLRTGYTLRSP